MVYKYERKTPQQSWDAAAMQRAIDAVKNDGMPYSTAAKTFSVPRNTLKRRVLDKNIDAKGNKKILGRYRRESSEEQEAEVVRHLLDLQEYQSEEAFVEVKQEDNNSCSQFEEELPVPSVEQQCTVLPTVQPCRRRKANTLLPRNHAAKHMKTTNTAKHSMFQNNVNRLLSIAERSSPTEDQYDRFGKHVSAQLRELPLRSFVVLQQEIQNMITSERLRLIDVDSGHGNPFHNAEGLDTIQGSPLTYDPAASDG